MMTRKTHLLLLSTLLSVSLQTPSAFAMDTDEASKVSGVAAKAKTVVGTTADEWRAALVQVGKKNLLKAEAPKGYDEELLDQYLALALSDLACDIEVCAKPSEKMFEAAKAQKRVVSKDELQTFKEFGTVAQRIDSSIKDGFEGWYQSVLAYNAKVAAGTYDFDAEEEDMTASGAAGAGLPLVLALGFGDDGEVPAGVNLYSHMGWSETKTEDGYEYPYRTVGEKRGPDHPHSPVSFKIPEDGITNQKLVIGHRGQGDCIVRFLVPGEGYKELGPLPKGDRFQETSFDLSPYAIAGGETGYVSFLGQGVDVDLILIR